MPITRGMDYLKRIHVFCEHYAEIRSNKLNPTAIWMELSEEKEE